MGAVYCRYPMPQTMDLTVEIENESKDASAICQNLSTSNTRQRSSSFIYTNHNCNVNSDFLSMNKINHERSVLHATRGVKGAATLHGAPTNIANARGKDGGSESILSVSQQIEFDAFNYESDSLFSLANSA